MKINIETTRGAKEYLIARIMLEAKNEAVPLSEVECRMLFLSKEGWTLPDMDVVKDAFERYHSFEEYESKVVGLIRNIRERDRAINPKAGKAWNHALARLGRENHYVLSLIYASGKTRRPLVEMIKFLVGALIIVSISVGLAYYIHNQGQ